MADASKVACVPLRIAPVPITPTKPLTPSHLKGLLCTDVMVRASSLVRPIVHTMKRPACDLSNQTLDFWSWLCELRPEATWDERDEIAIGELYVTFHQERTRMEPELKTRLFRRSAELRQEVERGWTHPSALRILAHWKRQFRLLGIRDPGLMSQLPLHISEQDVVDELRQKELVLDQRRFGGSCFLDLTDQGLPLRALIDADGQANYLLCTLRDLLEQRRHGETLALLCDRELQQDYTTLTRCLHALGKSAFVLSVERVALSASRNASSRHGGWADYTVDRIMERFVTLASSDAIKLGLRLYLIAGLGPGSKQLFSYELLARFIGRAQRILDRVPTTSHEAGIARLNALGARHGYVHPYRVTSMLLNTSTCEDLLPWLQHIFL